MSCSGNVNDKVENFKDGDLVHECLISRTTANGNLEVQAHTETSVKLSAQPESAPTGAAHVLSPWTEALLLLVLVARIVLNEYVFFVAFRSSL